jgi:serine/threonine protein kinase
MMADITNSVASASAPAARGACEVAPAGAPAVVAAVAEAKPLEQCRSGDIPHGTYHVAEKIGSGAYGAISTVYSDDGETFALKTFEPADDGSADIGTLRELSILRLLRGDLAHPFIMNAHDFYVSETHAEFCMVMPKAQGSLNDVLSGKIRLEKGGGKPRVAQQLLSALVFLHDNGIMHRDVKPDNVLLDADLRPVLCDFSLAVFVNHSRRGTEEDGEGPTHTGDIGTAVYMAPEVRA